MKKKELVSEIQKAVSIENCSRQRHEQDLITTIKIEMTLFENGGNRGENLTLAYKYLTAIPPTSVEAERIFSSFSFTSLSDRSLDAISFLRSYYQEKNEATKMI